MTDDEHHEAMGAMIHRGKIEQAAGRDVHREIAAERDALREAQKVAREALEIIAKRRQCLDNLMGNQDIAEAAIAQIEKIIGGGNA